MLYETIKFIHLAAVVLSLMGFISRSYFMLMSQSSFPLLSRTLPHYIDSLLLLSALLLVWLWQINPFITPWLAEKLVFLCVYIVLGMFAFHWAKVMWLKQLMSVLAIVCFTYIVYVAKTKHSLFF